MSLDLILNILRGRKVFDDTIKTWRVYDANGTELVNSSGILLQGLHGFLLRQFITADEVAYSGGYQKKRKRFKQDDPPTAEQINAERIRLGILEARKERAAVIKKAQHATKGTEQQKELETYSALLKYEITRLKAEYEALKAELERQGELIRSSVITRAVMAMIEEELQAAQQEEEIRILLTMFLEL